jgi:hypothetical protein
MARLHEFQLPFPAPHAAADRAKVHGLLLNSVSLGVCVHMAPPPLRLTKLISIFPRYVAQSMLDYPVTLHFEGCEMELLPGQSFQLHPPCGQDARSRTQLYLSRGASRSTAFAIDRWNDEDGFGRYACFHVRLEAEDSTAQWPQCPAGAPRFVRVDIAQATFPSHADQAPLVDGYFIVFRDPDFRGSEDVLFHVDNRTPHGFIVGVRRDHQRSAGRFLWPPGDHSGASSQWMHERGSKDHESLYRILLEISQSHDLARPKDRDAEASEPPDLPVSMALGSVITARPGTCAKRMSLPMRVQIIAIEDVSTKRIKRVLVHGRAVLESEATGLVLGPIDAPEIKFVLGKVGSEVSIVELRDWEPRVEALRAMLQDCWQLKAIGVQGSWTPVNLDTAGSWWNQLVDVAQAPQRADQELLLKTAVELWHEESSDGVQCFTLNRWSGNVLASVVASEWSLHVSVPHVSLSWVHRHSEVLALRVKGVDAEVGQNAADELSLTLSVQHLQVDHFVEGELPVVLNRRVLHINSRHLGKKAISVSVEGSYASRIIRKLSLEMVPYWLNLEIGVLLRLADLAESSFLSFGVKAKSQRVPLEPPVAPSSGEDIAQLKGVWRLMELTVKPLRLTVMVRTPDEAAVRDNTRVSHRIMRLPADMPNMDLSLPLINLHDRFFCSPVQLAEALKQKYKRSVQYHAIRSIILSYLAATLKGVLNAMWWLVRGPYDACTVARDRTQDQTTEAMSILWWVSPTVHGVSEGTYRAMAELIGNTIFGFVLVLNAIRQLILNAPRPRVQSILDGVVLGLRGLFLDSLFTPLQQLFLQTRVAYQDQGNLQAAIIFCTGVLRIPLGPPLGALHFTASCCEGLANILLHEEAQFAPFEPRRTVESIPRDLTFEPGGGMGELDAAFSREISISEPVSPLTAHAEEPSGILQRLQHGLQHVISNDDQVMEHFTNAFSITSLLESSARDQSHDA